MKFKKNEKFKHMKMYYYYMLTKTEDLPDTTVLHFDYDNGTYSITITDLMKKAKAEVEREKKKQK